MWASPRFSACMHKLMQLCMDRRDMHGHTDGACRHTYKLATQNHVHATQRCGGVKRSNPSLSGTLHPCCALIRLCPTRTTTLR